MIYLVHDKNYNQFIADLKQVEFEQKENSARWGKWQSNLSVVEVSDNMNEKVRLQLEKSKQINENMTKMLAEISMYVSNFRALDEVCKRPEVAVDYRDLDYENKLDFVDNVEPAMVHVTEVLARAKEAIEALDAEY